MELKNRKTVKITIIVAATEGQEDRKTGKEEDRKIGRYEEKKTGGQEDISIGRLESNITA